MSDKEIHKVLLRHFDKPERLPAFDKVKHRIRSKRQYWIIFSDIWSGSESLYQNHDVIDDVLTDEALEQHDHLHMMNKDERKAFDALPDMLTIYRGCWEGNIYGHSWTLNGEVALRFATRHAPDGQPLVLGGKVPKAKVFALLTERNEDEVVTRYEYIEDMDVDALPKQKVNGRRIMFQQVQAGTFFTPEMEEHAKESKFLLMAKQWERDTICKVYDEVIEPLEKYGFMEKAEEMKKDREKALAFWEKEKKVGATG